MNYNKIIKNDFDIFTFYFPEYQLDPKHKNASSKLKITIFTALNVMNGT